MTGPTPEAYEAGMRACMRAPALLRHHDTRVAEDELCATCAATARTVVDAVWPLAHAAGRQAAAADIAFAPPPGWESVAALQEAYVAADRERVQLRYERRLLGFARMTLDLVAVARPERWPEARREAEELAQRIVDEIGHPVTDEPALGPGFREEIAELRARLDRALKVVQPAQEYAKVLRLLRAACYELTSPSQEFLDAVDSYNASAEGG